MRLSRSIIAAWASILIEIMMLLVLRHPTCVSCVAWMCCRMSTPIKQLVCACPDLSFDRHGLYTFLHSLRSNFPTSRPLQLCFQAACEASLARDKYAMQSTPKSRRGRYSFICLSVFVVLDDKRGKLKTWHVLTKRAWVRGVGIDFLLQSCCCWCYVIQPVHHVLHECVVGCPILSSMHEHVLINHRGVGIAIYCNHVVLSVTSSNLCIMCCMNVL